MRVLLIGNSSIDEAKKIGKSIDNDFDLVIRMNRYEIKGFEEYLGSKTNIWVLNRAISLGRSRVSFDGPDCSLPTVFSKRVEQSQDLKKMMMITYLNNVGDWVDLTQKTEKYESYEVANTMKVSTYLKQQWDSRMTEDFYKPATGLLSIHYFLEKYDKIYIHNFDCGKTKHYWGDNDLASEPMSSKHNWSFDEMLISELVQQGKIEYL